MPLKNESSSGILPVKVCIPRLGGVRVRECPVTFAEGMDCWGSNLRYGLDIFFPFFNIGILELTIFENTHAELDPSMCGLIPHM